MLRALMISATGMSAQQLAMDNISNNLANVNTTGFKASQAKFADIFYQAINEPQPLVTTESTSPAVGIGVQNTAIERSFIQGAIETTGNPLDMAVQGEGFFQVLRPDGSVAYTRDGSFKVSGEGLLCTNQGYPIIPEVQIPDDAVEVVLSADGTVSVKGVNDTTPNPVAQLELARFVNPGSLESLGQNLFGETSASGQAIVNTPGQEGLGTVVQSSLERSNVSLVQEMVNMIMTQRAYEVNTKSIQTADDMMKMANNLRRV